MSEFMKACDRLVQQTVKRAQMRRDGASEVELRQQTAVIRSIQREMRALKARDARGNRQAG